MIALESQGLSSKPNILYILGSGRSGSTVVERVLNTGPSTVAVGELHALWRLPLQNLTCACGEAVDVCHFWRKSLATARFASSDLAEMSQLEQQFVRNRYLSQLRYDPRRIASDQHLKRFAALQNRLFEGLRDTSGAKTIVDSSKTGPRAWVLHSFFDAHVLHLYRDPAEVIASWRRHKRDPATKASMQRLGVLRAGLDWLKVELTAKQMAKHCAPARLCHQAFAQAPQPAMAQAFESLAIDLLTNLPWLSSNTISQTEPYHSILGNPDRFDRGALVVNMRETPWASFNPFERAAIRGLGYCLASVFPAPREDGSK